MKKNIFIKTLLTLLFIIYVSVVALAQSNQPNALDGVDDHIVDSEITSEDQIEKKDSYLEIILGGGLTLVFLSLFGVIFYTNKNEKILTSDNSSYINREDSEVLTEEERNENAQKILELIEGELTMIEDEEGNSLLTITKGSQARFVKRGLDYIAVVLKPTNSNVLDRVNEMTGLYESQIKREFVGSKFILWGSIVLAIIYTIMNLSLSEWYLLPLFFAIFAPIIAFYYYASKAPRFIIEKRYGGGKTNVPDILIGFLLAGFAVSPFAYFKHYMSVDGGKTWERDHNEEFSSTLFSLFLNLIWKAIMLFIAFILIQAIFLFSIINVLLYYATTLLSPLNNPEKWYQKSVLKV